MNNETTEINNGATPEFNRILELRKTTEFYFKTDCSNVYGCTLKTQHFQDKHNFQKKINSCTDAETLKAHLTETIRKWKGKKSQWIEYTKLSIAPPNSNNNVLVTSAWFEWFKSHKEQESEPISNDLNKDKATPITLTSLITHSKNYEIVKSISIQYKNIKGKRLKILLLVLQDLQLLPKERINQKFHDCCKNEFNWNIASYNAMNGYSYNEHTDNDEFINMKQHFEAIIKTK